MMIPSQNFSIQDLSFYKLQQFVLRDKYERFKLLITLLGFKAVMISFLNC